MKLELPIQFAHIAGCCNCYKNYQTERRIEEELKRLYIFSCSSFSEYISDARGIGCSSVTAVTSACYECHTCDTACLVISL